MPSPIIKEGWANALVPGIREWFSVGMNDGQDYIPKLYRTVNSTGDHEDYAAFGGISSEAWEHYKKTGRVPSVGADVGYKTTLTNSTFIVDLQVLQDWIEDEKYSLISSLTTELGASAFNKRQDDAASLFNNAFSSSYVGGDAVALCSDSHPYGPNKTGSTQDNSYALALTSTNVKTLRLAMLAFVNDVGQKVGVVPDTLLVPPDLEDTAMEIAQSELNPDNANNTINVNFRRWNVVMWPRLSDSNAWFMIDSARMKRHLIWQERINLSIGLDRVLENIAYYQARMRYAYGWSDWRWVIGSNPS